MQLQISKDPFLSLTPTQAKKQEPIPHTKFLLKLPTFKIVLSDFQFSSKKEEEEEEDRSSLLTEIWPSLFPPHWINGHKTTMVVSVLIQLF